MNITYRIKFTNHNYNIYFIYIIYFYYKLKEIQKKLNFLL